MGKALAQLVLALLLALGGAGGCAGVPVQEMSDARQMLQAAEAAGAPAHAPLRYAEARRRLAAAERALEIGRYAEARRLALEARALAAEAREEARRVGGGGQPRGGPHAPGDGAG